MTQTAHVAMTDRLKIELVGSEAENAFFRFSVFELINGTWHYLDSDQTVLKADSSDGQIRTFMANLAASYTDLIANRKTNAIQNAPVVMETY